MATENEKFLEDEKGKHNEFFWRRAFPEAFLWLNK